MARGVRIYALDLKKPILERLLGAKRVSKPDALARSPRPATFHLITQRKTLGSDSDRMEIIPTRGKTSEGQMVMCFPEYHLLYGSDPFIEARDLVAQETEL